MANRHTPGGEYRRGRKQRQMSDDSFHLFPRSFGGPDCHVESFVDHILF